MDSRGLCVFLWLTCTTVGVNTMLEAIYKMEKNCGGTFNIFPNQQAAIKVTYQIPTDFAGTCTINLNKTDPDLMLSYWLEKAYLRETTSCLAISTLEDPSYITCMDTTGLERVTRGNITLTMEGDSSVPPYLMTGFTLVITGFYHRSGCFSDERRCVNGRCVSNDLWCTGYNPCGDNSDQCEDSRTLTNLPIDGTVIAMIIVSVLILLIIASLLIYLRKRQRLLQQHRGNVTRSTQSLFSVMREAYDNYLASRGPADTPEMTEPPPMYDELDHEKPPSYDSVMSNQEIYKISGSLSGSRELVAQV